MICACTATSRDREMFLTQNFLPPILDRIVGGDKVYLLHLVGAREADVSFRDPIDGELLIELQYFDDEAAARSWIAADIALCSTQGVH